MEIVAEHGQITLSTVRNLHFDNGNGYGDAFLNMTGHVGDINMALRGAIYQGDPHWNTHGRVPSSVVITASNSHAGLGGIEPVAVQSTVMLW